jgi:DNA-binding CsgD family transcriptional regulator/tetratricopeptide (TPR) repeat protein
VRDAAGAAGAFERRDWGEAHRLLSGIAGDQLSPADLDRLAVAAYLIGRDDDAVAAWEAAHKRHLQAGERAEAARCAFWVAFCSMMEGRMAHAGGWLSRCEAVIGDDLDCPAAGYMLVPALLRALHADDAPRARDLAVEAGRIAARFADRDLAAFSTLGHGQALVAMGDERGGVARFDEVMLSVTSDEVGPIASGVVYCVVILECMQLYDLARAAEWTAALDAWCASQPGLVPYRGQCLVHKSQLQQAAGDWSLAAATVESARARLTDPPHPALGLACYQDGELHRLRGELDAAADAYGRASKAGYHPMPGLALLELVRGDEAGAMASIRRALVEANQPFQRPGLLAAAVEILVAGGDVSGARAAADELATIAGQSRSEFLTALSEQASGAVLLAEGSVTDALAHLRSAGDAWRRLRMPYEAARAAVLLGQGCLALGDRTSAALEFDNAGETLGALGARTELSRLRSLTGREARREVLSARELEVLARVARGRTNKEVADELSISQHTVGRHLENIFAKLGVSGRAAATAYAYEHDLL